jgi:hypothetical protein
MPPELGSSKFENAEGVFRHGHMQNKNTNHISSQLLSPRPTLPSSQIPPQFSWSEWSSEAPINVYQAYSEPTSREHSASALYSPQATEIPYSETFENQQVRHPITSLVVIASSRISQSTPPFYPVAQEFAEIASNPNLRQDSGYIQQPCSGSMPSFEEGPTQSTHSRNSNVKYYAAVSQAS